MLTNQRPRPLPRQMLMKVSSLAALALVVSTLAGCGSSSRSSTISSTAFRATITNFTFMPRTIHVTAGRTITWTNDDAAPHNVTYVSGPGFRSSDRLATGATFSITVTQAGTIQYYCSIHPWMKGTIVVSA